MAEKISLPVLDCHDCGVCCLHVGTPPSFYPAFLQAEIPLFAALSADYYLWRQMPAAVQDELRSYYAALRDERTPNRSLEKLPCLWYDPATKGCKHYEHRPTVCREFEVGGEDCLRLRLKHGVS
jgi:Fe-S-cluster containining protein